MARGKHAKAAANRRDREAQADVNTLVAQLLEVDRTAIALEAEAAAVEAKIMDLAEREAARDRAAAGEIERLRDALDELGLAVAEEEAMAEGIDRAWHGIQDTLVASYGGGLEGTEAFFDAISGHHLPGYLGWGVTGSDKMRSRAVYDIQRARGRRYRGIAPKEDAEPSLAWINDAATLARYENGTAAERSAIELRSRQIGHSKPSVDDPDVAFAWVLGSGVAMLDSTTLPPALGVLAEERRDAWEAARSRPDEGALSLAKATRKSAPRLLDRRWSNHFQAPQPFGRPSDAAVLRWWYRQDALAHTVTTQVASMSEDADAITEEVEFWREISAMLDEAALYWLPSGQAAAYLSSRALDATDRADLRLPYGRTMLVPAEPIEIPPVPGANERVMGDAELRSNLLSAINHAATCATDRVLTPDGGRTMNRDIVDLGTAIEVRGALIEAVLVEADRAGLRTGRIIWCIAVPSGDGTSVLSRTALPAWADDCGWPDMLDQLCAVAAWGDWIEDPAERDDEASDHGAGGGDPRVLAPRWLQILDVRRTDKTTESPSPTGRHIAPHTRRGHWRRQHSGPGGSVVKRVRIAPTVVNAARGPLAPRVYRLPREPRGEAVESEETSSASPMG